MSNEQLFEKIFNACNNLTKLRESEDEFIEDSLFNDTLYEFKYDKSGEEDF